MRKELVVDGAVVARLEPAEEALLAKALHHVNVALVTLGARALEALLDFLLEVVIAKLVQVVGGVALGLVVAVVL